ncbi:RICIN domain-containing protein [Spirosoma areae]
MCINFNRALARCGYAIAFIILGWLAQPSLSAQSLPTGFLNAKVQEGYTTPMGTVFTPDGQKLFVWDKAGQVWVSTWNGTQYVKQTTPVLNISDEVGNWRDFGLLSFCLDPNYAQNGLVYLFYVVDRHHLMNAGTSAYDPAKNEYNQATISRATRYKFQTAGSNLTADLASRKVLLGETKSTGVPLTHESHAGGTILFGRDGSLLISTGDNASYIGTDIGSNSGTYFQQAIADGIMRANENVGAFRSQMLNSHCGKVLRLDPATGDGLASNPFYDGTAPRSAKSRVWTLGLRNPYRMTIQPNTGSTSITDGNPGTLFIGDVGMGTWEDMQVVRQGGENAGWPIFEGLEEHSSYGPASKTLENKDEPNPTNTCGRPFLFFGDLLKQAANPASGTTQVINPCSQQPLPGLQRRYFHSRPALDWQHKNDIARTPTFSGNTATATILSPAGPVPGTPFRGNASTAGAYYAGTAYPTAYHNTYFFADYGANWIKAATFNTDGSVKDVREFLPAGGGKGIVDVEYSPIDGALYYVNINTGEIMKISFGGNQPPVAVISSDKQSGTSPLTVKFTGSNSSDPDGDPLSYLWEFGDGTTSTQANPTKVFSSGSAQGFTVRLTVSDGRGLSDSKTLTISLNNAVPTARITAPVNNALYPLDRESQYKLTASVTDEDPASLTYAWQVALRHNNHEHREPVQTGASPTVAISPVGCDGNTYYYLITLKVTDKGGLSAQDSVKIYPDCNSAKLFVTNAKATPQTNAVVVSWTNASVPFDDVLVVAKAGSGFSDKPNQTTYTADANFTGNGAVLEGGKVVFQGRATTVTVTNLTAGQTYFFRIYTRSGNVWTGGVEVSAIPTAPATPAPVSFDAAKCYRLTSRTSGKVLGVANGGTNNGDAVNQYADANKAWQQWKLADVGSGYYRVMAAHSDKALDVLGWAQQNLAGVGQWTYSGNANQQWAIQRDGEGYYQLTARHSGKRLDVENNNQNEGGNVVQYSANGTKAQQWSIEERTCVSTAPTPVSFDATKCYRITARVSGKVLGVENGATYDGATVRQRTDANRAWQQWKLVDAGSGYYRVTASHSGKVLDVSGVSQQNSAPVQQWGYGGGTNQQWAIQQDAEGYYSFKARHSGKVMDVNGGSTADGAQIIQYTPNGGTNQQWRVEQATCSTNNSARLGTESDAGIGQEAVTAFRLWPNPAHDDVQIDLSPAGGQLVDISLVDISGNIVHQTRVESETQPIYRMKTAHFTEGTYLVRIKAAGQPPATLRLLLVR